MGVISLCPLQLLHCHSKRRDAPYIITNSSWLHITTVLWKSGSPIKTGNLMVCNITTLTHTLVGSAASAVSELTTITVISVTGDCLRQRDNEQQQMRACTAKVAITQSCLRAKHAGQYGDGSFGTYHFFPSPLLFPSTENYPLSLFWHEL